MAPHKHKSGIDLDVKDTETVFMPRQIGHVYLLLVMLFVVFKLIYVTQIETFFFKEKRILSVSEIIDLIVLYHEDHQ